MTQSPLKRLEALCHRSMSGVFLCESPGLEVYVYLRAGRLAWASNTLSTLRFSERVYELTGLERETFRRIVADCRTYRMPLVESLITIGAVEHVTVKEAYREQIIETLGVLCGIDQAQTVFLTRKYHTHNPELTFTLTELLGEASRLTLEKANEA